MVGYLLPWFLFISIQDNFNTHRVNSQYIYFVSNPVKNIALLSKCAVSVNRARVRLTKWRVLILLLLILAASLKVAAFQFMFAPDLNRMGLADAYYRDTFVEFAGFSSLHVVFRNSLSSACSADAKISWKFPFEMSCSCDFSSDVAVSPNASSSRIWSSTNHWRSTLRLRPYFFFRFKLNWV